MYVGRGAEKILQIPSAVFEIAAVVSGDTCVKCPAWTCPTLRAKSLAGSANSPNENEEIESCGNESEVVYTLLHTFQHCSEIRAIPVS